MNTLRDMDTVNPVDAKMICELVEQETWFRCSVSYSWCRAKGLPRPLPHDEEGFGPCDGLAECRAVECEAWIGDERTG